MAEILSPREFAHFLIDTDDRISPSVVSAVATALVPQWDLRSELVRQNGRVPDITFHRMLGPFSDEHEHDKVLGEAAAYLKSGSLAEAMESARAQISYVTSTNGITDASIIIRRDTPPNGMHSRLIFGELLLVEIDLVEANCVQQSNPSVEIARTLLSAH